MKAHDIAAEIIERQLSTRRILSAQNAGVKKEINKMLGQREPLLDMAELGRALGVSTATIIRMVKDGLPFYSLGRGYKKQKRRFKISEVEAWMRAESQQSEPPHAR